MKYVVNGLENYSGEKEKMLTLLRVIKTCDCVVKG